MEYCKDILSDLDGVMECQKSKGHKGKHKYTREWGESNSQYRITLMQANRVIGDYTIPSLNAPYAITANIPLNPNAPYPMAGSELKIIFQKLGED